MAQNNKNEDCDCLSKWDYLNFALEKDQITGKSLLEKFKSQPSAQQLVANEVLILNLVFFRSQNQSFTSQRIKNSAME